MRDLLVNVREIMLREKVAGILLADYEIMGRLTEMWGKWASCIVFPVPGKDLLLFATSYDDNHPFLAAKRSSGWKTFADGDLRERVNRVLRAILHENGGSQGIFWGDRNFPGLPLIIEALRDRPWIVFSEIDEARMQKLRLAVKNVIREGR